MAINAYTGLMGSGKTYEVVASVIVPAVMAGRRVITNIDGIRPEAIHSYCIEKKQACAERLGQVILVQDENVLAEGFFPRTEDDQTSRVRGGDLLAIDEAWRFWSTSQKITPAHMQFFRMHRHYTHSETGAACDVALIVQSVMDLHRQVRAVIELTFRMKKLKELGAPRLYRIEMYESGKVQKSLLLDTFNRAYDKDIFALYRSYASGSGTENRIDARQNLLANKRFHLIACGVILIWALSGVYIWRFFAGKPKAANTATSQQTASGKTRAAVGQATRSDTPSKTPSSSKEWRLVGSYLNKGERLIVIADAAGRLRVESPSAFARHGVLAIGEVDGQRVAPWTGAIPGIQAPRTLGGSG